MWPFSRFGSPRFPKEAEPVVPCAVFKLFAFKFGETVVLRGLYSPDKAISMNVAALHGCAVDAVRKGEAYAKRHLPGYSDDIVLNKPFCEKVPARISKGHSIWIRDFRFDGFLRTSTTAVLDVYEPTYLSIVHPRRCEFLIQPSLDARISSRNRVRYLASAGGLTLQAALVQANAMLFSPGDDDMPALVVFGFDPDIPVDELHRVASELAVLKDESFPDAYRQALSALTTDELFVYQRRRKLPLELTNGLTLFAADIMLFRHNMPEGRLTDSLLTIMVQPGEWGMIEHLPPM